MASNTYRRGFPCKAIDTGPNVLYNVWLITGDLAWVPLASNTYGRGFPCKAIDAGPNVLYNVWLSTGDLAWVAMASNKGWHMFWDLLERVGVVVVLPPDIWEKIKNKTETDIICEAPWLSGSVLASGAKGPWIGSAQGQIISRYTCCSLGRWTLLIFAPLHPRELNG